MATEPEEEAGGGIPEWVVTFGDMMSLLLTFFIMLVSLSEIKEEEKYQALIDSIRKRFGHDTSVASLIPGSSRPRNAKLAKLSSMGRAKRLDTMRGGNAVKAPAGEHDRVRIIRPGRRTVVGSVIPFAELETKLTTPEQLEALATLAEELRGKPQKIEVRGHSTMRPLSGDGYQKNFALAYERCRSVMEQLVKLGIERERLRLSVAGPHEPIYRGADINKLKANPRVEVFMLDEVGAAPRHAAPGAPQHIVSPIGGTAAPQAPNKAAPSQEATGKGAAKPPTEPAGEESSSKPGEPAGPADSASGNEPSAKAS